MNPSTGDSTCTTADKRNKKEGKKKEREEDRETPGRKGEKTKGNVR